MTYEKSCGAVVFTRIHGKIKYVLVQQLGGFYGFPKGHTEGKETELETALREIWEEVHLKPKIIEGFKTSDEYALPGKEKTIKTVVYFLAEFQDQEIKIQEEELLSASLMTYEEAINAFQYESSKRILKQANDFLSINEEKPG